MSERQGSDGTSGAAPRDDRSAIGRECDPSRIVETNGLTKRYGTFTALDDCSLSIARSEVVGLLGPNGAGKSTLIRLLIGAIEPTAGSARILGLDCRRQRVDVHRQVAYLPGDARLPKRMKGPEVLRFFAAMRGLPTEPSFELARRMDLDLARRVGAMSTGMRQKLAIAVTLAAEAPVTILDEPTANLDPTVRAETIALVREARERGTTVIFSSHVLSEIEQSCDRVAILRRGRLVHDAPLAQGAQGHRIRGRAARPLPPLPEAFGDTTRRFDESPGIIRFETTIDPARIVPWLAEAGLSELTIEPIGLETLYARWHAVPERASASGAPQVAMPGDSDSNLPPTAERLSIERNEVKS